VWQGWRYLVARPGLIGLVVIFALVNFFVGTAEAVLTPMILSFTTPDRLGVILSVSGVGMLIGGVLMSIWGGGQRKVYAAFGSYALLGLAVVLAGTAPSVGLVTAALFLAFLCLPTLMGASQAIMQVKVAPDVQGRVFALRAMLNTSAFAVAYLIGGPLADQVFEPLMADGGLLAGSLGQVIGVGPGRGMGLMFVVMGSLAIMTALSAFAYPRIRNVEVELPDAVES
jgi:MFS family permease